MGLLSCIDGFLETEFCELLGKYLWEICWFQLLNLCLLEVWKADTLRGEGGWLRVKVPLVLGRLLPSRTGQQIVRMQQT